MQGLAYLATCTGAELGPYRCRAWLLRGAELGCLQVLSLPACVQVDNLAACGCRAWTRKGTGLAWLHTGAELGCVSIFLQILGHRACDGDFMMRNMLTPAGDA